MEKDRLKKGKRKYSSKNNLKNKVTDINTVREKAKNKKQKHQRSKNFYYSFLTIILLIFSIQMGVSAILNISKTIAYHDKIVHIKQIRDDAEKRNKQLKKEIKDFSKSASLEAIARNNLKMAGEDEVLIIINNNKKEENESKKKKGIFR